MVDKIQQFIDTWKDRCYMPDIPDDAPEEIFYKVPSYRRIAIAILSNDIHYLGYTPKQSLYYGVLKGIELAEKRTPLKIITMKQLSLMPDERPDKEIKVTKARRSFKSMCEAKVRNMSAYNYCMMAMKIKSMPDEYNIKNHGIATSEAWKIANSVFGESIVFQDTIESFLENVKNIPGYGVKKAL